MGGQGEVGGTRGCEDKGGVERQGEVGGTRGCED